MNSFYYEIGGESLSQEQLRMRAADNGTTLDSVVEGAVAHAYQEWCKPGDVDPAKNCGFHDRKAAA